MMKKILSFSVLLSAVVFIFASTRSYSGELQFLWSKYLDSGVVFDMEFMPDNNYFIMGTYYYTQIRETATGNVVQTYPFYLSHIEFTPDSTKMITQHEYNIQMRNINDLSVIKQYTLPWGTDTTDLNYEVSSIGWDNLVVDPIRPLCYGLRVRSGIISNNKRVNINRVMIYNYETMEEVGELTTPNDISLGIKIIAVSKDGKYLAAITAPDSHILVWDLNTRQKIRDFKVCSYIPNVGGGEPDQLTFSEINTDNIYFSGSFPQTKDYLYDGLLIYNINQNKIIDSTFALGEKMVYRGTFALYDNEERCIKADIRIRVINLNLKAIEKIILQDTISSGPRAWAGKLIYSRKNNYFIGCSKTNDFSSAFNNTGTSIPSIPENGSLLFPNPTTGEVIINNIDIENIKIFNILGNEQKDIHQVIDGNNIRLNVSSLPNGEYFIVIEGRDKQTYKLIINK